MNLTKKVIIFASVLSLALVHAQISTNLKAIDTSTDENVFLDASTNFNPSANSSESIGKGLAFPQTDLTKFQFKTDNMDGINYPSYLDGMIIYNIGTGLTNANPALGGVQISVSPGFYYFSNPNGAVNGNINSGQWKPFSSSATGNFWSPTGNTGTTAGTNFVGTTDAQNVVFKSNSASTTAGYNPTKIIMGNATDTPTFTKVVIGGTVAQQAASVAAKTRNVQPAGQATAANFDFAMEVYGKSWFADGIVTSASTYPDYVFDNYFTGTSKVNPTYQFKSLAETEKFIKENNHLPGVTKIDDLAKGGNGYMIDATQLSIQSLEKIEELYLHTIKQQKEIDALKAELVELKALLKK